MNIRLLPTLARVAGALALSASILGPAQAATPGAGTQARTYGPSYCNASSCSLSNGSSTSQIYTEIPRGTGISMLCWTDSQYWNGTNRWFRVDTLYGPGYVIATQVSNQTRVGHCSERCTVDGAEVGHCRPTLVRRGIRGVGYRALHATGGEATSDHPCSSRFSTACVGHRPGHITLETGVPCRTPTAIHTPSPRASRTVDLRAR